MKYSPGNKGFYQKLEKPNLWTKKKKKKKKHFVSHESGTWVNIEYWLNK